MPGPPPSFFEGVPRMRAVKHEKFSAGRRAYHPTAPFSSVEGIGTEPFRRLSPPAIWVLLRFYEKFNGFNRADLSLTYREVKGTMSSLLFSRSIWELVGFGFLDIRRFGRLQKNCSIYSLSNRWRSFMANPQKCDQILNILNELERIQRERGSQEKRQRVWMLRNKLFKVHEKING